MSKAKKVKDIKDLTAVRWWWKADYQNGLKKIQVDDERFVDCSLTVSPSVNYLSVQS
jgi:hypothetical protein